MKRREFVKLCASSAAVAAPGVSWAQQPVVWKASDVHPLGYPTVEAIVRMGKKLEKETNGRISIQMYPLMQLGGEKEMIEQAQVGALQIARISVGAMGPVVDDLNVFNLPFIFRDEAHMRKGDRRPDRPGTPRTGHSELAVDKAGRAGLDGRRHTRRLLESNAGHQARGSQGPEDPDDGQSDVRRNDERDGRQWGRDGLQRAAAARCRRGSWTAPRTIRRQLLAQNHYTVTKVYSRTGHLIIPEIFVFSKRTWDTLSKADQDLVKKLSREAQFEERKLWDEYVERGRGKAQGARREVRPMRTRRRSTRRPSRCATSTAPSTPRC